MIEKEKNMKEKKSIKYKNIGSNDTWDVIQQRMKKAADGLLDSMTVTTEEQQQILHRRSLQLAKKEKIIEEVERMEVVEFRAADELYAVECSYVREVYPLRNLTPVPGTPGFILGIISVRGEIFSVVDIKDFFGLPFKGLSDMNRVIILSDKDMQFGILAEEVMGTMSIPVQGLMPSLPTLTGIRADYLKGITDNRVIVLDAARLLSDKKMIVHQEVEA